MMKTEDHWALCDIEKRFFYINTTTLSHKARTRRRENVHVNRKKMSYKYYLHKSSERIRVCKEFYLKTLDIDSKRIVNAHKTKSEITGMPLPCRWGKHVKKVVVQAKLLFENTSNQFPKLKATTVDDKSIKNSYQVT